MSQNQLEKLPRILLHGAQNFRLPIGRQFRKSAAASGIHIGQAFAVRGAMPLESAGELNIDVVDDAGLPCPGNNLLADCR
jgi:hypothetical protein